MTIEAQSLVDGEPGPRSEAAPAGGPDRADSAYAWYALSVLVLVYVFNGMDRSILSILAEDIKRSFTLTDSQIGFLYGTAFSVFYALLGYPVGRLMDRGRRTRLLALGLGLWSLMTMACGLSAGFVGLAAARIGVGVGEASASPAGFSLTSDWFTKKRRGLALGLFICGFYIGGGLALALGGPIAQAWDRAFETAGPFGLVGWQGALLALGAPGLLLAAWVATLREPPRGLSDDIIRSVEDRPWRRFLDELAAVTPPFTLLEAARLGRAPFLVNAATALAMGLAAWLLIRWTGDLMQWVLVAVGYYAVFSAAQSMKHRDPPTFALTWRSPSFLLAMIGFGGISSIFVVMSFWVAPLSLRVLHVDKATSGVALGAANAVFGVVGVIGGGKLSDVMLRFSPAGRIWVGIASTLLTLPFVGILCTTTDPRVFYLAWPPIVMFGNAWIAAGAATIQELVLPRMRGAATTIYFFTSTMIGSALGPYLVGKISTATGSLGLAMLACALGLFPFALVGLVLCARGVEGAETGKWERAHAAGEPR